MSLIRSCLNTHINNIQCKQATLLQSLVTALSYGTCTWEKLNTKNISTSYLVNRIKCYTPFEEEVTYASKIVFTKPHTSTVTVDLSIGVVNFTQYNAAGTAEDIVDHFLNDINNNTTSPDFYAEKIDNILYIYSYDTGASFTDVTTVTIVDALNTTSGAISSLENDLDEILNIWNCSTEDQMCSMIKYATSLVDEDCGC